MNLVEVEVEVAFMLIRFRYSARCETVDDGKTSTHRPGPPIADEKRRFQFEITELFTSATVAKATSILVDRVEQCSCRRRIKAEFNGCRPGCQGTSARSPLRASISHTMDRCCQRPGYLRFIGLCSLVERGPLNTGLYSDLLSGWQK
jgi:hypothetical protein